MPYAGISSSAFHGQRATCRQLCVTRLCDPVRSNQSQRRTLVLGAIEHTDSEQRTAAPCGRRKTPPCAAVLRYARELDEGSHVSEVVQAEVAGLRKALAECSSRHAEQVNRCAVLRLHAKAFEKHCGRQNQSVAPQIGVQSVVRLCGAAAQCAAAGPSSSPSSTSGVAIEKTQELGWDGHLV